MQRLRKLILFFIVCAIFYGCEGTNSNPVPFAPVHVVLNTKTVFIDFLPGNTNTYVTVTEKGYYKNGKFVQSLSVFDAYGYAGIVAYISILGYTAYDMACPYCAAHGTKQRCTIDGIFAICPHCGEQYDLGGGFAMPQKNISPDPLRSMSVIPSDDKITITQK